MFLCALLAACAVPKRPQFTPPSSVAVVRSVAATKAKVEAVKKFVRPEGAAAVRQLELKVEETQLAVDEYVLKVEDLSARLGKAQDDAVYWQQKHYEALKIIWRWRLIALLVVGSVVLYIGIKTAWKFYMPI